MVLKIQLQNGWPPQNPHYPTSDKLWTLPKCRQSLHVNQSNTYASHSKIITEIYVYFNPVSIITVYNQNVPLRPKSRSYMWAVNKWLFVLQYPSKWSGTHCLYPILIQSSRHTMYNIYLHIHILREIITFCVEVRWACMLPSLAFEFRHKGIPWVPHQQHSSLVHKAIFAFFLWKAVKCGVIKLTKVIGFSFKKTWHPFDSQQEMSKT